MDLQKPNLFLVGQPKSGTTALHNYLEQHPDIYMSNPKEPRFFCKDLHLESYAFHKKKLPYFSFWEEQDYLQLFSNSGDAKIVGESSPHYLYSKVAAEEIYKFNPHANIIMILRNPVDFIYSVHSQLILSGFENVNDLKIALSLEKERKKGKHIPSRVYCPSGLFYSERIKYYQQVRRYYDVFNNSNIKVIIFEDFRVNNYKVYRDTLKFLGVDHTFVPETKMVNVNKKPRNYTLNILFESPSLDKAMKAIFPQQFYAAIKKIQKRLLWKEVPRPPMNPLLKKSLMGNYRAEVIKISDLLGIDLEKKWFQKMYQPLMLHKLSLDKNRYRQ